MFYWLKNISGEVTFGSGKTRLKHFRPSCMYIWDGENNLHCYFPLTEKESFRSKGTYLSIFHSKGKYIVFKATIRFANISGQHYFFACMGKTGSLKKYNSFDVHCSNKFMEYNWINLNYCSRLITWYLKHCLIERWSLQNPITVLPKDVAQKQSIPPQK